MTGHHTDFLVRVADVADVATALAAGADRLGLTDAAGPLTPTDVRAIVAATAGRCPVGGSPSVFGGASGDTQMVREFARCGVDWLEVSAGPDASAHLAAARTEQPTIRGVVVFPAAAAAVLPNLGSFAEQSFGAALLIVGDGGATRLIDDPGIEALARFVDATQRRGMSAWIAGRLEPPDVPRLLALRPDALAFRTNVARDGRRAAALDPARIAVFRTLIPTRDEAVRAADTARPTANDAVPNPPLRDRVFVRDFVVTAGIGAYGYEHRAPQRMRFNVEAELARIPHAVADMRDVFSYDVIVDAIRLATRRHVLLVERIALDVAAATLQDARVRRVRVRVEKLDIIEGAVGVEIERDAD